MRVRQNLLAGLTLLAFTWAHCSRGGAPSLVLEKVLGDPAFKHCGSTIDIVPLPDGKRLLTSGHDGSARLWDLSSGEELCRYVHKSTGYIWDIFLLPSSQAFLSTSHSGKVIRWELDSGKQQTVCSLTNSIFSSALSPDGKLLAVAGDKECLVWDLEKKRKRGSFAPDSDEETYAVAFLNGGEHVIAGFDEGGAVVKKSSDMTTVFELPKSCDGVYRLVPSPKRDMILACTSKRGLICLNTKTFKIEWEVLPDKSSMYAAAWSPDQKRVAVSYKSGEGNAHRYVLSLLDAATGQVIHTSPIHQRSNHYGIAFAVDGKSVLCGSGNTICRFSAESGKRIHPEGDKTFRNDGISWLVAPASMETLLVRHTGKGLLMIDAADGAEQGVWRDEFNFSKVCSSPDSKLFAGSTSSPVTTHVIDFKTDKILASIDTQSSPRSLTLANNNNVLASASYRGVSLHNLRSGTVISGIGELSDAEADVAASQNPGPLLALADDALIRLIDTEACELTGSMTLSSDVTGMAFYPADGRAVLAAAGTNLYLWAPDKGKGNERQKPIRKAVERLGSRRFKDREESTEYLITQGSAALEYLKDANLADPEVRDRAARIRKAIITRGMYGQSSHILATRFGALRMIAPHPSLPLWICLSGHPSDTRILLGDVSDGKIRILSDVRDPNGPQWITFGKGNAVFTGNQNGTISRYRLETD